MTDDRQLAIGVDVGGTKIAFALVNRCGDVLAELRLPTRPDEGVEAVLARICEGVNRLLGNASYPVAGVGIGSPGHVDPSSGVVRNAVNMRWSEVALRDSVRERLALDLPVWIGKDANASALGEMYFGAARSCRDFVYIAIGTGLGGGAVVGGELVLGATAYAMEIGHMSLDAAGRLCACGMRGCPEMYVSGIGLLAGAREHLPEYPASALVGVSELTTAAILSAARAGDLLALKVIDEMSAWLSTVLMACATLFNPTLVVIGGGLGRAAADLLIGDARQRLRKRTLAGTYGALDVVESQLHNSAIGAACLVWHGLR